MPKMNDYDMDFIEKKGWSNLIPDKIQRDNNNAKFAIMNSL